MAPIRNIRPSRLPCGNPGQSRAVSSNASPSLISDCASHIRTMSRTDMEALDRELEGLVLPQPRDGTLETH